MVSERASVKLLATLKGCWFSTLSHRKLRPLLERKCVQLFSNGNLLTDIAASNAASRPRTVFRCRYCFGRYLRDTITMPTRVLQSCVFDENQSGNRIPISRHVLPSNLLQARFCIPQSFASTASQNADVQADDGKAHPSESRPANGENEVVLATVTCKAENVKSKDAASNEAACEEALQSFEVLLDRMEASAGSKRDQRLGATCLRLAQLSDSAGVDPGRILSFGQRALRVYKSANLSWEHVACLHVIGHAYFKMGDFANAVAHLEQSACIQRKTKPNVSQKDVYTLMQARESLLGQAKMSLGRFQQAIPHFQKSLKIAEKTLEPGSPDLGVAYLQAAQAYKEAKDPHEAVCLCIKAVDNHANYYGPKSSQAADIRRFMSTIYFDLKEYENALLEYEEIRPIFEGLGKFEVVAALDLAAVESLLELERFDDAIFKLNGVVNSAPESSTFHGNALIVLGKVNVLMKDHECAGKHSKMALDVLQKQQASPDTGSSLVNLALLFQRQQNIEMATSTYKRALEIYSKFSGFEASSAAADIEGQIGFLLLHAEKVEEALPFLERSVLKKKAVHGANSVELLDVHNHLGVAYSEEGKLDEALKQFEAARSILSKNLTEVDSLTISIYSNLSNMYTVFGRFQEAIECQEHVVDLIRRNPDVETMISLDEAKKTLEDLHRQIDDRNKELAKAQK